MKTNEFVSILLCESKREISNNARNRIGFISYEEPIKENEPINNEISVSSPLLSELAIAAFLDALKEWLEFELTNYTCGGFGCKNDYQLRSKIEAIRTLYPKRNELGRVMEKMKL